MVTLVIGLLAGLGFARLYPSPTNGAGAGLIHGAVYGFFWWVVGALTLVPLFSGAGLQGSMYLCAACNGLNFPDQADFLELVALWTVDGYLL